MFSEDSPYSYQITDEEVAPSVQFIKEEIDKMVIEHIKKEAGKEGGLFCTKCQKICSGIDCECTKKLKLIEADPDGDIQRRDKLLLERNY